MEMFWQTDTHTFPCRKVSCTTFSFSLLSAYWLMVKIHTRPFAGSCADNWKGGALGVRWGRIFVACLFFPFIGTNFSSNPSEPSPPHYFDSLFLLPFQRIKRTHARVLPKMSDANRWKLFWTLLIDRSYFFGATCDDWFWKFVSRQVVCAL